MAKKGKKWFQFQVEKETENEDLGGQMVGGEITPILTKDDPKEITISFKKLTRRLNIINRKIRDLKDKGDPRDELEKWRENKAKTKALLWVYYDK